MAQRLVLYGLFVKGAYVLRTHISKLLTNSA